MNYYAVTYLSLERTGDHPLTRAEAKATFKASGHLASRGTQGIFKGLEPPKISFRGQNCLKKPKWLFLTQNQFQAHFGHFGPKNDQGPKRAVFANIPEISFRPIFGYFGKKTTNGLAAEI